MSVAGFFPAIVQAETQRAASRNSIVRAEGANHSAWRAVLPFGQAQPWADEAAVKGDALMFTICASGALKASVAA
jgi:hypothetical protein